MIISLPDKYTIDNSEKNILSIRLNPGGLSFSIYNPSVSEDYLYREILFDKKMVYAEALKECFFENSFFTWSFQATRILQVTPVYTLMPTSLLQEKQQARLLSYNFERPTGQVQTNQLKDPEATLIFDMPEDVYEFCSRSFIHPEYIHHLCPLFSIWKEQSSSHPQKLMYVLLHENFIDVVCYHAGKPEVINSFTWRQPQDILYYILYIWKQREMDQLNDILFLSGKSEPASSVTQHLQMYLNNVHPMEIPSDAYLKGGEILKAPLDLIALSL